MSLNKLEYQDKFYLIEKIPESFNELLQIFEKKINKKINPNEIELHYVDQDNDVITISNDLDLKVIDRNFSLTFKLENKKESPFFREILNQSRMGQKMQNKLLSKKSSELEEFSIIKGKQDLQQVQEQDDSFEIYEDEKSNQDDDLDDQFEFIMAIHENSKCDICQTSPIKGIRYKCSQCLNFDACDKCFEQKLHPHDFKQITIPQQIVNKINKSKLSNIDIVFPYLKDKETNQELKNLTLQELKVIRDRVDKIKEILGDEQEIKIIRICINTLNKTNEEAIPYSIELIMSDNNKINSKYPAEIQKMAKQLSDILEMRHEKLLEICKQFKDKGIQYICEKVFEDENILNQYPTVL
ncbi:hypothetical protein PPERSA_08831 [Pseudocohnilembus persalinus]|uniref:ZZ-type domain-containing protein n=1 Tax=Pseudocohnilembus persalinus TaxID=266149 RepID=A0A0V0R3R1_PSEPJ|nr:hypothetical protein PPERSA_08831 [Pseudocohnilembus persalinus]|eukprot:KRX09115.1 hypothetical protein PPERSA_08831 [Pseudocohnilembus persalinus]